MLRSKLFKAFAGLVILFGALSAWFAIHTINKQLVAQAQTQVSLNLSSAWSVYNSKLSEIESTLKLVASQKDVGDMCQAGDWQNRELHSRLESIRITFGLDFLSIIAPDGKVMVRTSPPYHTGDYRLSDSAISKALQGESSHGMAILTQTELHQEADGLAEQAFIALEADTHSRPSTKTTEDRGLVMQAATPVKKGPAVVGALYGGILLNRNQTIVDTIKDAIYQSEAYKDRPLGTATIFINDIRVCTTVRLPNGNRALGTRASKEVADRVLDNAQPWSGRALVIKDWYLAAYDPIRDGQNKVIGMLYVGILEQPLRDLRWRVIAEYGLLAVLGITGALLLAFILANQLAAPIHRLVTATRTLRLGQYPSPVSTTDTCIETRDLIVAFNKMTEVLAERETTLKEARDEQEKANTKLQSVNRNYMETLAFVSHEMKTPIATMLNYVYLLNNAKLGPLNEKQAKACRTIDNNIKRLTEMVRHYLNLSRIENNELTPTKIRVTVLEDVIQPLLELFEPDFTSHHIQLENRIAPTILLLADVNMTREVFENLVSNAVKYGREGGLLSISCRQLGDFIEFAVRNEGDGIPADRLEHVFDKFTHVNNLDNGQRPRGSGLGLFITKHVIEAHGGRIEVESRPQQWTEFRFTLPVFK